MKVYLIYSIRSLSVMLQIRVVAQSWLWSQSMFGEASGLMTLNTTLWFNTNLPHLWNIWGGAFWALKCIKYLGYIFPAPSGYAAYAHLKQKFHLPNSRFYRYLQLCGTLQVSLPNQKLRTINITKPLTCIYTLLQSSGIKPFHKALSKWTTDPLRLSLDDWK